MQILWNINNRQGVEKHLAHEEVLDMNQTIADWTGHGALKLSKSDPSCSHLNVRPGVALRWRPQQIGFYGRHYSYFTNVIHSGRSGQVNEGYKDLVGEMQSCFFSCVGEHPHTPAPLSDVRYCEISESLGRDDLTTMKYMQQVVLHCCTLSAFYRLQFSNSKRQKPQLSSTWPRWELCVEPLLGFIVQWSGCTTCPSNREGGCLFYLIWISTDQRPLISYWHSNNWITKSTRVLDPSRTCLFVHFECLSYMDFCPEDVGWHAPGSGAALCSGREGATTSSFQRSMAGFR